MKLYLSLLSFSPAKLLLDSCLKVIHRFDILILPADTGPSCFQVIFGYDIRLQLHVNSSHTAFENRKLRTFRAFSRFRLVLFIWCSGCESRLHVVDILPNAEIFFVSRSASNFQPQNISFFQRCKKLRDMIAAQFFISIGFEIFQTSRSETRWISLSRYNAFYPQATRVFTPSIF